jgi:glucose-6-phosphate 1-epimerase
MNPADIEKLNKLHVLKGRGEELKIESVEDGIPLIEINNRLASASICLQGAHLLSWVPHGHEDALWLSRDAKFAEGKSIRGGIPVCWPWFSAHQSRSDFPSHGFARTSLWKLDSTEALQDGSTRITLSLHPQAHNEHMWFSHTALTYVVTIGKTLQLELVTQNLSEQAVTIGQALHTYFRVSHIGHVTLHGLDQALYLDKLDSFHEKQQQGPIIIDKEVDRIYIHTRDDCVIEDAGFPRKINIHKEGSHSTVVWNPWKETADIMGDLGTHGFEEMLCVESANVANDHVEITPGASHRLQVEYEIRPAE